MKKTILTILGLMLFMVSLTPTLALEDTTKSLRMLVIEVRENRLENQSMINELKQLKLDIKTELKEIRESGISVEEETLNLIKSLTKEIREIRNSIMSTKGDIKELQESVRPLIKERQWEEVSAIYNQIIEIQEIRNQYLVELLEKIRQLSELVKSI
jgi:peptidoglycan hydrolase CwlO-like protein